MTTLDRTVRDAILLPEMWRHLEYFCSLDRTSGTEGECRAVEYVVGQLRRWGVPVQVYEFDALLSYPRLASLEMLSPGPRVIPAKTRSFSGSTPDEGVQGEIVYVPGGTDMFRDYETAARLESVPLAGKIVLSEGGGRENMIAAQQLGSVGYVHMWPSDEEHLHEGIVSPVWGTPTSESASRLPRLPVVTVTNASGRLLRELASDGRVVVRLRTSVETRWRRLQLPVADIPGRQPAFVLVGGHLDSWHRGATDNATGNACCLELARVFWKHRDDLLRGVRIAWWPGHSTGRYAGSTWYADYAWQELHDHCVAYVNIDSPGSQGATDYSVITAMAETAQFACQVVRELTGQDTRWERPSRAGDQSFWGPGVTSLFMLLSNRPEGQRAAVGGSGMGWWWHTEHDTLDKVDPDVLLLDTKIYATAIARLCTLLLLPYRLADLARELKGLLSDLAAQVSDHLDLGAACWAAEDLCRAAETFDRVVLDLVGASGGEDVERRVEVANRTISEVLRLLVPINYTAAGPFEHDPAVPLRPLPGLQAALQLPRRVHDADAYGFLRTGLIRQRNRVLFGLVKATEIMQSFLRDI